MYQFTTYSCAGLQIAQTVAKQGTDHKKRYVVPNVTPQDQDTLNIYVNGQFRFDAGAFTQTMSAGQTSLDLTIGTYPLDEVCVETVLSPWGTRWCVSSKQPWRRDFYSLTAGQEVQAPQDCLVVLLSGEVVVGGAPMKPVSYRLFPKDAKVTASETSTALVCRVLT